MSQPVPLCMRSHFVSTETYRIGFTLLAFMLGVICVVWSMLLTSASAQTAEPVFQQQEAPAAVVEDNLEDKPDGPPPRIPVLNYHSITVDPGNRATITPEKFEAQMNYLHANGYTTLTLEQFIGILEGRKRAPAKPVLLTFDDGYADNYVHAMPVLKKLGFHATLFMSPGMVDDGWFLNWDQVKEMHQAGWDIQPHGINHPYLNRLKQADQEYQLTEARRQIEEQLGTTADVFCYPYGQFNQTTLNLLKKHGFRYAFTIEQGFTTHEQDKLKLKRVFVNGEEHIEQWIYRLEKW
ncbi:polysaccharide deacetylase family protein [Paenibacillus sp. NPDC056579]|uniref:polysaccharide deacetylase family protein n=1 Tax=Paenibacillus sp. NPDC056579 TaxID=3345871 RepID=UPI0036B9E9EE